MWTERVAGCGGRVADWPRGLKRPRPRRGVPLRRPVRPASHRIREKASVFLAELHPAPDAAARGRILAALRKTHHDANHHCTAWREGLPVASQGSDDDGEPAGTAGRPMLRVLEGAGLTDCLAVCVRWFGGTKLGTGGLVRAYTEALQGALAQAEAEGALEPLRLLLRGQLRVPAASAHLPFAVLGAFPGVALEGQAFQGGEAIIRFAAPPELADPLAKAWSERSRGLAVEWDGR